MKPKYVKELGLTPDEAAVVQRYRDWLEARRLNGRLARIRAEVERQYPELSEAAREEQVEAEYRRQMTEYGLKGRG